MSFGAIESEVAGFLHEKEEERRRRTAWWHSVTASLGRGGEAAVPPSPLLGYVAKRFATEEREEGGQSFETFDS
jgi:hypothetical protein